ncbi:MAG: SMC-Scp complex subunit ScpB [Anaerolineae bacterium]|nr:SMC-Scp complex subunit ScpB [Anaerolineae bacterium]MCO5194649.1 SMC-Scp complex subunit ScpB [Anaerolineae bacterium]
MSEPVSTPALSQLATLECLLFVASGTTPISRLARAMDVDSAEIQRLLHELELIYADRGLRVQWHKNEVQLTTAPEASVAIELFLGLESTTRLSQAALEVLSIVAYMQPTTRPQIDQIRGVNSDGALRNLLGKGLVEEVGRLETPGRPILYGTTAEFLQHFGLASLAGLPALAEEVASAENTDTE